MLEMSDLCYLGKTQLLLLSIFPNTGICDGLIGCVRYNDDANLFLMRNMFKKCKYSSLADSRGHPQCWRVANPGKFAPTCVQLHHSCNLLLQKFKILLNFQFWHYG